MATILIVDDDPAVLTAFATALHHASHEVDTAANAADALQVLERNPPDLVLLDLKLNGRKFDGLYLLRRMRERIPALKIVVVSAYLDDVTRPVVLAAGALECWPKPVPLHVLVERTAQVLAQSGVDRRTG